MPGKTHRTDICKLTGVDYDEVLTGCIRFSLSAVRFRSLGPGPALRPSWPLFSAPLTQTIRQNAVFLKSLWMKK